MKSPINENHPIIGVRTFTDSSARPVYSDGAERQYVLDDDGNAVYGVWIKPIASVTSESTQQ
jgi:hypothetical protein